MNVKETDDFFSIGDDLKQVFENKFTINIGQKEIIKMKNAGVITERDLSITKFLFKFKFSTLTQLYKHLEQLAKLEVNSSEGEDDVKIASKIGIKNRLDKLVKYRVLNKFTLTDDDSQEVIADDSLVIYCLDLGGRYLLSHYSNEDTTDWYTTVNMKASSIINKNLFVTEFYLRIMETCPTRLESFTVEPDLRVANKGVVPSFDMCFNINGQRSYFVAEVVRENDFPIHFRDKMFKLEGLLQTNAWKKYYYDSQIAPVLFIFTNSDEIALEASKLLLEATEIRKFRLSTDERIKRVLYDTGAFLKYVVEKEALQEIKAITFTP